MIIIEYGSIEELNNYVRLNFVKALGVGREGSCFLMPDGNVIKILYSNDYYVDYLEKFEGINNPSFIFPSGGILINSVVKALIQDYAKGERISKIEFEKYSIESLKKALLELKANIIKLSEKGIKIYDAFSGNILFDGINFTLIDTQGYEYVNEWDLDITNISEVMKEIYKYLFINNYLLYDFIRECNFRQILCNYDLLANPDIILDTIKETYKNKYGYNIETLEDIKLFLHK